MRRTKLKRLSSVLYLIPASILVDLYPWLFNGYTYYFDGLRENGVKTKGLWVAAIHITLLCFFALSILGKYLLWTDQPHSGEQRFLPWARRRLLAFMISAVIKRHGSEFI